MTSPGHEQTPLLRPNRLSHLQHEQDEEAQSIISSSVTKEERELGGSAVGERLPYNDYTTIDWLHDLVRGFITFCGLGEGSVAILPPLIILVV
jgi:chloride channel 3/4/5